MGVLELFQTIKKERGIKYEMYSPRKWYLDLVEGTIFYPWMKEAWHNGYFYGKPINLWFRHSSYFERVARVSHIGLYWGVANFGMAVYYENAGKGITGSARYFRRDIPRKLGWGLSTGFLQWASFALGTSIMSDIRGGSDDAMDYFFGAVCAAGATSFMGAGRHPRYSYMMITLFPAAIVFLKTFKYINNWDAQKGGPFKGPVSGPEQHNAVEMWELYHYKAELMPMEKSTRFGNSPPTMNFLKPRANPDYNDQHGKELD